KRLQEKLRADKVEKDRLAQVEREEKAEKERAAKAETKRLADIRKANLDRMLGQVGSATGGTGTAAQSSGPSAAYGNRLGALIRSNSVFTGTIRGNPPAVVEVRTGPSGNILSRRLVKSSGHPEWDDAVLRAIDRTARLPADTDGRVPPVLTVEFKPNE
ncbi:MAG: cell envelope integrity protein TolA, partial [Rubrivivax sp.]